jgi:hypothetical protein
MDYLHEIAWYFNMLSDKCDIIRKLDMDKYKHCTDKEILELLLHEKIIELEESEK